MPCPKCHPAPTKEQLNQPDYRTPADARSLVLTLLRDYPTKAPTTDELATEAGLIEYAKMVGVWELLDLLAQRYKL